MLNPKRCHYNLSQVVYAAHFVYFINVFIYLLDFKVYSFINSIENFQHFLYETLFSHTGLLPYSEIMHQKLPMQNPIYKVT